MDQIKEAIELTKAVNNYIKEQNEVIKTRIESLREEKEKKQTRKIVLWY